MNGKEPIRIEYSPKYLKKYFVFIGNNRGYPFVTSRKDKAIQYAKKMGADERELEIHVRNVVQDLVNYSIMSKKGAIIWLRKQAEQAESLKNLSRS